MNAAALSGEPEVELASPEELKAIAAAVRNGSRLFRAVLIYGGGTGAAGGVVAGAMKGFGCGRQAPAPRSPGVRQETIVARGRLQYSPGFRDVWVGDTHFDLRERAKARLCLQYLVEKEAFDASSARHLLDEIDPYVRKEGDFPPAADIEIDHYFNDRTGKLPRLRRELIASAGRNGRYCAESKVQSPKTKVLGPKGEPRGSGFKVRGSGFDVAHSPAAADYLSRFLCAGFAVALLATGCAGPQPLKGGRAVTTRKPAGVIEQSLTQGENASQATKQDQESIKVRAYTVPAGSRVEQSPLGQFQPLAAPKPGDGGSTLNSLPRSSNAKAGQPQPTINSELLSTLTLSAPMPVVEREETRARTELGAAQKDTARDLAAKFSSLKGIVCVGVGLFAFGLASLMWPPLKAVIGSVTTSAAIMLGGLALMVLPSLIVGNELLILGAVGLTVGAWFLAHRHGQLKGEVSSLKSKV